MFVDTYTSSILGWNILFMKPKIKDEHDNIVLLYSTIVVSDTNMNYW